MDRDSEEKIKSATNIVDVIGDFVTLYKKGVGYVGICPFHDDHNLGNFQVSPSKQMYKCFSCGAGGDAIKFLMDHEKLSYGDALRYLAKKFSVPIDDPLDDERYRKIKPSKPRSIEDVVPEKELLQIPRDIVSDTIKNNVNNIFCRWFRSLPWDSVQRQRVEQVLWLYCVGAWRDGRVVFWQIDENGIVRSGKLMRYVTDGHRDKTSNPGWIHNQEGIRERLDMDHHEYRSTLFGAHLLKRYPKAVIHLVESEKTALIMSCYNGKFDSDLWLACGGLRFLKPESMKPLFEQGRTVHLWPDKDGLEEWEILHNTLKDMYCAQYDMRNLCMNTRYLREGFADFQWHPEDGEKADIADITLRYMRRDKSQVRRNDPNKDMPFMLQDEINNPDLYIMRQKMSRCHSSGWGKWPNPKPVPGDIKTIGEIIQEHPLINQLIELEND